MEKKGGSGHAHGRLLRQFHQFIMQYQSRRGCCCCLFTQGSFLPDGIDGVKSEQDEEKRREPFCTSVNKPNRRHFFV